MLTLQLPFFNLPHPTTTAPRPLAHWNNQAQKSLPTSTEEAIQKLTKSISKAIAEVTKVLGTFVNPTDQDHSNKKVETEKRFFGDILGTIQLLEDDIRKETEKGKGSAKWRKRIRCLEKLIDVEYDRLTIDGMEGDSSSGDYSSSSSSDSMENSGLKRGRRGWILSKCKQILRPLLLFLD